MSDIVRTHKDRLLRFGSDLIFLICKFYGIRIHIIYEDKNLSDEQVLAFDVLEIITVFSGGFTEKGLTKIEKSLADMAMNL